MNRLTLNPDKLNPAGWHYESDGDDGAKEHYLAAPINDNSFDSDGRYVPRIDGFTSKADAKAYLAEWHNHWKRGGK